MDTVEFCTWCGETVRVMERTARYYYANQDGTPHFCGQHRELYDIRTDEAEAERSEAG